MTGERVESEGFFEMLWDCDHCGQQGLLGKTQRHCPECGAPDLKMIVTVAMQRALKEEDHAQAH